MSKNKKRYTKQKNDFLMTFFDEVKGYDERQVNGWWLVKSWNGNQKIWQVAIYPPEAYYNYKEGFEKYKSGFTNTGYLDEAFKDALALDNK